MKTPAALNLDENQLSIWFNRLKRAYRARRPFQDMWERMDEYLAGKYFTGYDDEHRVCGDWHLVAIRQQTAQLYSRDPAMNFVGRTPTGVWSAGPSEKLTTYERGVIGASREERKALINALTYGTGITKYAWNAKYGHEMPFAGKKVSEQAARSAGDPSADMEDAILPQGPFTEHDTRIVAGHPWVIAISPYDFLVDPEASSLEEARWMAHRFRRPWIDAKRDERWDSKAREMMTATGQSPYFDDEDVADENAARDPAYQDASMVTFYEIYDKTTRTCFIVSANCDRALIVKPYPYQGRLGPYRDIKFLPSSKCYWGRPWADTFTPQVLAINLLRTQMMDHLQRYGAIKGVYDMNAIDHDTMQRIGELRTAEFAGVQRMGSEPIQNYIEIFPYPPIAGDAWRLVELLMSDYEKISGISENALGGGSGSQTATEASIIERQSGLRTDDMRGILDDYLAESTRAIVTLLRQFYTGEQVFSILGEDGQIWLQTVTAQTLNGEYDVGIEPGSTERIDRNARMRQSIELLQVMTPMNEAMMTQGEQINFKELLMQILRNTDVVKNPDKIVMPVPPPPPVDPNTGQPMQQQPQQQGMIPGQQPAPADVNGLDQVVQASAGFQNGRQLSEAAGAFN